LVEQGHKNERVETHRVQNKSVSRCSSLITGFFKDEIERDVKKDELTKIHQNQHYEYLISSLPENLSPHFWHDNLGLSAEPFGLAAWVIWLSSDSDCA